jgi:hypothetical protein
MTRVLISDSTKELVETIKTHGGVTKSSEVVNNAISLLRWAVNQTIKGRDIASYDYRTGKVEVFSMPLLDRVAKSVGGDT